LGEESTKRGTFDDQRGAWNRKNFSSIEKENAYLKAQVEKAQSKSTWGRSGPKS
jgi:transposase